VHSEVGPSIKDAIIQCRGIVQMSRPFMPQPPTEATLEGDAADWCAHQYYKGRNILPGTLAPNGVEITEEMIRGAVLWRDTVGVGGVAQMMLLMPWTTPDGQPIMGTADHYLWKPKARRLVVNDYKFGHRYVDAFENWQCMDYAIAILHMLGEADADDITVCIRIVQPRYYNADPIRTWEVGIGKLREYATQSERASNESLGPNPECRTGNACLDCPASHACATLRTATGNIVEYVGRVQNLTMEPDQIGRELQIIEDAALLLEARANGLRAQAESLFFGGKRISGWMMERTWGRLKWKCTPRQAAAAADAQQINIVVSTEPEVCTPTQARQRGMIVNDELAHRPSKGWKLVRDDGTETRKIFGVNKV